MGQYTSISDQSEQVLDFIIPTSSAHRWLNQQQLIHCERCGAQTMLSRGERSIQCPYCGSSQVLRANPQADLIEPHLVGIMKVNETQALAFAKLWLGRGFFSPDNLMASSVLISLRPGYYSFWTFDGSIEIPWSCEVLENRSQAAAWAAHSGVETRFFNDVLIPGVKSLPLSRIKSLEPFNLQELKPFDPAVLAGWPTVFYDRSLSDSSLLAREQVVKIVRPSLNALIEPGREKRNLVTGSPSWSGMTFKHILIPLWVGEFRFRGKQYPLLVNGQTGKVVGEKPRDSIKILFSLMSVGLLLLAIFMVYLLLSSLR